MTSRKKKNWDLQEKTLKERKLNFREGILLIMHFDLYEWSIKKEKDLAALNWKTFSEISM